MPTAEPLPAALACPVTTVVGDADDVWPPSTVDAWADVSGPGHARVVVPDAGHLATMNHEATMRAVFDALQLPSR